MSSFSYASEGDVFLFSSASLRKQKGDVQAELAVEGWVWGVSLFEFGFGFVVEYPYPNISPSQTHTHDPEPNRELRSYITLLLLRRSRK